MTVIIKTTNKMVAMARRCANEVVNNLPNRPNYTGDTGTSAFDRYFPGYLGEFAVRHWFDMEGVEYTHHVDTSGRSQGSEFIVRYSSSTDSVEVKTSGKHFHQKLMVPLKQRTDFDLLIAARVNSLDYVELMGWLSRNQVEKMCVVNYLVTTREMEYTAPSMRNIENLTYRWNKKCQ